MQNEYLEMRGTELFIDGICIAEVTNLEDAMAISDRVSNYVAELQRKIEKLERELCVAEDFGKAKELELAEYMDDDEDELEFCWVSGLPLDDCCCDECDPDYEFHPALEFPDESEDDE